MRLGTLALLACLCVAQASAQEPPAEARRQFEAGLSHARNGQWALALAAFTHAYELAPRPSVLFNLAGAQLRSGKMLHAHANYERIRESRDPSLTRAHKRAAQAQQKYIEEHIPRLRVQIEGLDPDDRVLLDRTRLYATELEVELWVDPGEHVLTVLRPNGRDQVRRVVLAPGQHLFLTFQIR